MPKLPQRLRRFQKDESGPTVVEYAILLALLVGVMIASIVAVGDEAHTLSDIIVTGMDSALNN